MTDGSSCRVLRIFAVGPLPPPPGGVASSMQSLLDATRNLDNVELRVIPWHQMWRLPLQRPDVLHLNFSKPAKRALGTIFGRLCGSSIVHTIHGNTFDFGNLGNLVACRLSQGFILLNAHIMERFRARGIFNTIQMTPILETCRSDAKIPLSFEINDIISKKDNSKIALVYSNSRREIDGLDIYGFGFIASALPALREMGWNVIFLDPNGNFEPGELFDTDVTNALLHRAPVDFRHLLKSVDVYLRPTSTDGNSVAVLEALALGTPVLASNAVPRPNGVMTYTFDDKDDFLAQIRTVCDSSPKNTASSLTRPDKYVAYMKMIRNMRHTKNI